VTIALETRDGKLELTIRDSGVGFSPGRLSSPNGLGLKSMAERAELLGGKLSVDSDPGHGTRLHVHIPLENESGKGEDPPRTS
jgi:signal transduction histidine kinase